MNEATEPWILKAEEDIKAGKILLESGDYPSAVVCFHAQQAVEKYLKAFLTEKGIEFRRTHDLLILLDEYCLALDDEFDNLRIQLNDLTDYAIEVRYPGGELPPTYTEAANAMVAAIEVRQFVLNRLD